MIFPCKSVPFSGQNEPLQFLCVLSGAFNRRKRNSIYVTVTLLIVSVLILTVGLAATTRTQNVTVGGYYPGVIVSIKGLGRSQGLAGCGLSGSTRRVFDCLSFQCLLRFPPVYFSVCVQRGNSGPVKKSTGLRVRGIPAVSLISSVLLSKSPRPLSP